MQESLSVAEETKQQKLVFDNRYRYTETTKGQRVYTVTSEWENKAGDKVNIPGGCLCRQWWSFVLFSRRLPLFPLSDELQSDATREHTSYTRTTRWAGRTRNQDHSVEMKALKEKGQVLYRPSSFDIDVLTVTVICIQLFHLVLASTSYLTTYCFIELATSPIK